MKRMVWLVVGLAALSLEAREKVTWKDVRPVFQRKCAVCHSGPFLDLSKFPFHWSESTDQKRIMDECIARMRVTGWKKMPPVNAQPLTLAELRLILRWYRDGMAP